MAGARVTMRVEEDGVAIITLSNPPVNSLAASIIEGLLERYDEAMRRRDVKAVVLIGEACKFSGGFDINVLKKVHETGDISAFVDVPIHLLINTIEDAPKPFVAAIQGLALGGGLELALGCHARICAPRAQLGFPELSLGVLPGTQRLPRLAGLKKAVEMMLSAKPITSEEGNKFGFIDAVVPPQELLNVSRMWALDIAERRKPWIRSLCMTDKLGSLSEAQGFLMKIRQQMKQTAPNMPHYQVCLDVIEEGIIYGGCTGIIKEEKVFKDLILTDISRGLVHAFFALRMTSKIPGVTDVGLKPRRLSKVALVGGGSMGSGIATALLLGNMHVVLKEVNSEFLAKAIQSIEGNIRALVTEGELVQDKTEKALSSLKGVLDYSEFKDVDMVIEAVVENIQLKQTIFCELEKACPRHCILATTTSTIDLNTVGEYTSSMERIIGAHIFSPAHIMPLVEIVRTEKTSAQVVLDLVYVGKIIKKVPAVVYDGTRFVNRIFSPYCGSARTLAAVLGVDIFWIDKVVNDFGLPIGPFQLEDLAGNGVEFMLQFDGSWKNNEKSYYTYEKGSKPKPNISIVSIFEDFISMANFRPSRELVDVSDKEIVEMVLFPVVNEACRVLDEGIVVRASDLDVASVHGMGFPSYRGGIVFWADTVGPSHIYRSLLKWTEQYGDLYKPSRYLEGRASKGLSLSAPATTLSASKSRL